MKRLIYADNAATTKLDEDAFTAMVPYLKAEYGNPSQPYSFSRAAKAAIAEARATIAECIGASPDEIFFTSGGTESDNWAIKGSAFSDYQKRATITSSIEHHAVLRSCAAIERLGYPVAYLPVSPEGVILPEKLEQFISDSTRLVSVMLANNEIGTIEPIQDLCTIAHEHGALFHTDAVQAVGHVPLDVKALGIDMLSASAHKFNGMKGSGFLYVRKGVHLEALESGGAQESGKRAGTENVASIVAMAVALRKNCSQLVQNAANIRKAETCLLEALQAQSIPFIRNGTNHLPGNLSLSFPGKDGEAILHRLDLMGISVSTGAACDSKNVEISHVLQAIKLDESLAKGTIRVSLGKENTEQDAIDIANALKRILG